jgi:hypothetical protein
MHKTLSPRLPPGRANRKALPYGNDIRRLRAEGYTFSAIRLALLDVGISISLTTVKREAARAPAVAPASQWPATPSSSTPVPMQRSPPTPATSDPPFPAVVDTAPSLESIGSFTGTRRTGRQIVDAFMEGRTSNPLIQQGVTK